MSHARPGAEQVPNDADTTVARAMHALRPAGLPWAGLDRAAHRNLAIAAMPLRRALTAQGWVAPTALAERIETAAQLIHDARHRAGSGQVCGGCRDLARTVAGVLTQPATLTDPDDAEVSHG